MIKYVPITFLIVWVAAELLKGKIEVGITDANITSDDQIEGTNFVCRGTEGSKSLDIYFTFLQDTDAENAYIQSKTYTASGIHSGSGTYVILLPGRQINLCRFLKKPTLDPFLKIFVTEFSKYSSVLSHCPIKKGSYQAVGFKVNGSMLPSFIPPGKYIEVVSFSNKINGKFLPVLEVKVYVDISRK